MSPTVDRLPSSATALFRSLRMGYRTSPGLIMVACATTIAAAVPDALFAVGLAFLVEGVSAGDGTRIGLGAALVGVLAGGGWLLNTVSDRVNRRFADRAAVVLEAHVARLQSEIATIEHHERPEYQDRISVLRDHADALSMLYSQLFGTAGAMIRLVLTVGLLMSVNPLFVLIGLAAIPGVLVANRRAAAEKAAEEAGVQAERRARHLFTLGTSAGAGKEIRVAGVQDWLRETHDLAWQQRYAPLARARWISAGAQAAAQTLFGVAFVVAVGWTASRDGAVVGAVTVVLTAGSRLSQYIAQTISQTQFFRAIWLDVSRRLAWLEDYAAAVAADADLPAPERLNDGIHLRGLTFRYAGSPRPVLDDISLHLPAGRVIAIVGENGAGKSTLVKLLCGFYRPTEGEITVDDTPLSRIEPHGWRLRLAGAFQDFFRFEYRASVSVGLGDLSRIDDPLAVENAVDRAGARDVIAKLDDGLATQLGVTWENGTELSEGQWQKIALARGFMRDEPLLLVLDEPTSALDAEIEHELFERFAEAARTGRGEARGQITILVSHRFSTVRMADLIVVLDGARVAEHGTHAELMATGGTYAELYGIQAAAYHAGYRPREQT